MGLALLVWVGGGLLKRVLYFLGNEPSLGHKSPILHLHGKLTECNKQNFSCNISSTCLQKRKL